MHELIEFPEEYKLRNYYKYTHLDEAKIRKFLQRQNGGNYTVINRGSWTLYPEMKWAYLHGSPMRKLGNKGMFLCHSVKKQVKSGYGKVKRKGDSNYWNSRYSVEDCINIDNIKRELELYGEDNQIHGYDMEDCYWNVLYILGYIDKSLHDQGLENDIDYKSGRVAAIGSLGMKLYRSHYKNNILIKRETINPDPYYLSVRSHVINYIWEMFREIIKAVGDDFMMFFKDCIYISNIQDNHEKIKQITSKYKLSYWIKPYYIQSVDESFLRWHDFREGVLKGDLKEGDKYISHIGKTDYDLEKEFKDK